MEYLELNKLSYVHHHESKQKPVLMNDSMEESVERYLNRDIVHLVVEYRFQKVVVDNMDQMMLHYEYHLGIFHLQDQSVVSIELLSHIEF